MSEDLNRILLKSYCAELNSNWKKSISCKEQVRWKFKTKNFRNYEFSLKLCH